MAYVAAGIKEVLIGSSTGTPMAPAASPGIGTTIFGMGVRNAGTFNITHMNELSDFRGRKFANLVNFKAEMPTMQFKDAALLKAILGYAKVSACSVALATSGISKLYSTPQYYVQSPNGGVFLFQGADSLGIDFEMTFGMKERLLKFTLERAFKYDDNPTPAASTAQSLLIASTTNKMAFETGKIPYIDQSKVPSGFISPADAGNTAFIPASTAISGTTPAIDLPTAFADINLVDFMVRMKTVSQKNGMNVSRVRGIAVELMARVAGPDIPSIIGSIKNEANPDIIIDLDPNTASTTTLTFKANGMRRVGDAEISDDKREASLTWAGEYDIDLMDLSGSNPVLNTFLQ